MQRSWVAATMAGLGLTLVFAGCTTGKVKLEPQEFASNAAWSGQGILLSVEIPEEGCELELRNLADNTYYQIPLEKGKDTLLVSAPKGGYRGETLSCTRYRRWELNRFLRDEVELVPQKINYIGHVHFKIEDEGKDLSIAYGDRKQDTQGLARGFKKLPAAWKKSVVLASTAKPVRESMLADRGSDGSENLRIRTKRYLPSDQAGSIPSSLDPLQKSLTACDQDEQKKSSVRIGHIVYQATYQNKKFVKIDKPTDDHAFSDDLEHCFDEAFERFAPLTDEKIEVTLEL